MDRVASELGIAKGTLYLYFSGKQELFLACVDQGMQDLQRMLDDALAPVDVPFERIAHGIWAFLRFFDEHPEHIELLIQERAMFRDRKRPTFFEYRAARRERYSGLYTDLVKSGQLRSDLPIDQMMETVGNMLYGTMFTNYFEGRSVPLCRQFDTIVEVVFRGILSPAERDRLARVCPPDAGGEICSESPPIPQVD